MYLSAQDIAHSRDRTLNNLLGLSAACFDAGQRLAELFSAGSREAIQQGSRQWSQFGHGQLESVSQLPTALWLEHSSRASRLLDAAFGILGETHKALIRSAEAQVRVFDEIVFATLDRAHKASPWEAEIAIGALRTTLQAAESTLHDVSAAAIETVEVAEQESRQLSQGLAESKPARRRSTRSTA